MKRTLISLFMVMASCMGAFAMSYEMARQEALYLTDKMAYELNLNDQQYNDAYEINLDYLMSLNTADDIAGAYLDYRATDFRSILYDWQWNLFIGADYFLRPVMWRAGGWYYPIYGLYHRDVFFYSHPHVYWDYCGAHSHHHYIHTSFYANRRPRWEGGFRGHDRVGITHDMRQRDMRSHMSTRSDRGHTRSSRDMGRDTRSGGREMHFDSRSGRMGNSFNQSSTRSSSDQMRNYRGTENNRGGVTSHDLRSDRSSRQGRSGYHDSPQISNGSSYSRGGSSMSSPTTRSNRGSMSPSMSGSSHSSFSAGASRGGSFSGGGSHGGGSHGGSSHGGRGGR